MAHALSVALLCIVAFGGLHDVVANRGFVGIKPGPPEPPSKTCGTNCCPSNQVCVCGGCFPQNGPFPVCAFPDPSLGIVYSCCDDVGAPCNRCNGDCCLGSAVCSCKGTCVNPGDPMPLCTPDDFGDFGNPLKNCCETPETSPRCSGPPFKLLLDDDLPDVPEGMNPGVPLPLDNFAEAR